jgi:O-acetyl-ADP-ribose deacetylase (regulator of RNase III)
MSDDEEHSQYTDELSEDEDEEMETPANVVSLDCIPNLGEAYKYGLLKPPLPSEDGSEEACFQPNLLLLDRVSLFQGDITKLRVDAIVNAANRSLLGGGGVDGAIHTAAGPKLLDECRTLNGCETGASKITKGYNLPARHVIHTVGPIYSEKFKEEKAEQLASCYRTSLEVAAENEIRHIAFPSISTGIYCFPIKDATRIALGTTRTFLESEQGRQIENVIFVVWSDLDKAVYESILPEIFPPAAEEISQDLEDNAEID